MQKYKGKNGGRYVLIVVMLLSFIGMIYFGVQKEGYHVDEIYSYGLANSEYLPFMHFGESGYDVKDWMLEYGAGENLGQLITNLKKDYEILKDYHFEFKQTPIYQAYVVAQANSADTKTTTWVSGQEYRDYIAVSPENTFNYASVYYNQRGDVHPPFYYMVLHTICSVFQGSFSKWYGLCINIVFMLFTIWILYHMCREFCGGELLALTVIAIYAFSQGFMTTAMLIRMYAMLTFWVVLSCYLHLRLENAGLEMTKKEMLSLAGVTIIGFYTHYYFVLYAMGIGMVCSILMIIRKRYKAFIKYILTLSISAIVGICIWPFAIKHVFFGYRGRGSLQSLTQVEYFWIKVKLMLNQIFEPVVGGKGIVAFAVAVLVAVLILCIKKNKAMVAKAAIIVFPCVFYTIMVSQIVPFYTDRYVMCIYPFVCMVLMCCVSYVIRALCDDMSVPLLGKVQRKLREHKQKVILIATMVIASIVILSNNYVWNIPGNLCSGGQETISIPKNTDCVYVLPDGSWNVSAEESSIIAECRDVAIVYEANIPVLERDYKYSSGEQLMICIHQNLVIDQVLDKLHTTLGTGDMKEINRMEGNNFVRIMLAE